MAAMADEFTVREKFFPKLARVLARVPLAEELVAVRQAQGMEVRED